MTMLIEILVIKLLIMTLATMEMIKIIIRIIIMQ